jgi:cytochrome c oxidase subunit IV
MNEREFKRHAFKLLLAWLALLVLMLSSLGSAYLSLGVGNLIAGVAIAIVKSSIVALLFMRLAGSSATVRLVAVVGIAMWLLLAGLSGVDYATRSRQPAAFQLPRQLPSLAPEQEPR